jgi:predicted metal-dependent peptidase
MNDLTEAVIIKHLPDARVFQPSTTDDTELGRALRRLQKLVPPVFLRCLTLHWVWSRCTPYGATDGRLMILNPEGLQKIRETSDPVGYLAFLLLHEGLHAMLNHGLRLALLPDRKLANVAADFVINYMIVKINSDAVTSGAWPGGGPLPFPMIPGGLLDPAVTADLSAEELYRELDLQRQRQPKLPPKPKPPKSRSDDDDDGDGDPDPDADRDPSGGKGKGKGKGKADDDPCDGDPCDGDPSDSDGDSDSDSGGRGKVAATDADDIDEDDGMTSADDIDPDWDKDLEDFADGDGSNWVPPADRQKDQRDRSDDWGDSLPRWQPDPVDWDKATADADALPDFAGSGNDDGVIQPIIDTAGGETLEDVEQAIDQQIERLAIESQINAAANVGDIGMLGIDAILAAKQRKQAGDWHEQVKDWFSSQAQARWNKPMNVPVYKGAGIVAPDRGGKVIGAIAVAIDVSYSVPEDKVKEMLGEIQFALDTLRPACIHLIEIPDYVRFTWELFPGDVVPEKLNYGGGTRFQPAFDWVRDNVPDCAGMIYMTDGDSIEGVSGIKPADYPVLWLDWSGHRAKYTWGEYASCK